MTNDERGQEPQESTEPAGSTGPTDATTGSVSNPSDAHRPAAPSWEQPQHVAPPQPQPWQRPQALQGPAPLQQPTQHAQPSAPYAAPVAGQVPGSAPYGQATYGHLPSTPYAATTVTETPARRRRRPVALLAIAGLVGGTVLGGAAGAGAATLIAQGNAGSTASSSEVTVTGAAATDPATIADVADTASDSVVTVDVTAQSGSGTGSGVVVGEGGIIVTNNHVVTLDGAAADAEITVETTDGRLLAATVVGTDPSVDLAVLQVDADLPVIAFADSSSVSVGDTAIAIGSPLGLSTTVTDGIVSAVDRGLQIASSATDESSPQAEQSPFGLWSQQGTQAAAQSIAIPVVQTDASINPGNSGGALLNAAGQLIGVNVAIASMSDSSDSTAGSIGIGFAIEATLVQRVVDEIVATGTATHGLLGSTVSDVTDASVGHVGAQLAEISDGGAAAQAGLLSGDVVTAVDGTAVTSATDLTAQVRAAAGGDTVTLTILRGGQSQDVDVTLGTL